MEVIIQSFVHFKSNSKTFRQFVMSNDLVFGHLKKNCCEQNKLHF